MIVCGHGNVAEFCRQQGMVLSATYDGDLKDYTGKTSILVTDQEMCEEEYYFLKGLLLSRDVNLIHTKHKDDEKILGVLAYTAKRQQEQNRIRYGGRQPFGFQKRNGEVIENPATMVIARRIIELSDTGCSLRSIQEDTLIRYPDGRKIGISTIQQIIKNREKYERK